VSPTDENERKVYDLIARHFLASVGKDAVGEDNKLTIQIGAEKFSLKGFSLKFRNFLEIYTFQ